MSGIEQALYDAYLGLVPADPTAIDGLTPQYGLGRLLRNWDDRYASNLAWFEYRLDFAVAGFGYDEEQLKIAVEVDGYKHHHRVTHQKKDAKRQRAIEALGWTVLRFKAGRVRHDPSACAAIIYRAARQRVMEIEYGGQAPLFALKPPRKKKPAIQWAEQIDRRLTEREKARSQMMGSEYLWTADHVSVRDSCDWTQWFYGLEGRS